MKKNTKIMIVEDDTDINNINIKATTSEHMGYCGSGEGMEAHAVCLVV